MATTQFDPNNAQNLIEWDVDRETRKGLHALPVQTYWNLLEKVEPSNLKLTKIDDEIFEHTMNEFPELKEDSYAKVIKLDEEWMKSPEVDVVEQMHSYEKKVKDYNFGSLIRTDAREEYGEMNTIFVTRIQFYAFEIARNRLGLNAAAHEIAKAEAEKQREKQAKDNKKKANGKQ
ncbi:uncharacterized protein FIBRA_07702 [Fibroporia radiculosa]|uniref:Polysaccharide biosynthesis domain-containing protein n=1 Tax=Fibroporia radiculosa TaxID=599839 RepID=J4IBY7_9APHY|nr:uncharacterized protein FIBRA_07702 [Fibroporia radiculosa]CCM05481.1 predicted protein [Fibroporia radiculosa]